MDSFSQAQQGQHQRPCSQSGCSSDGCPRCSKEGKRAQRGFLGWSMVKPTPCQTYRFSVLETSTVGSTEDMLTLQSPVTTELRTKQAMPELPPYLIHSATLCRGTNIPLQLNTIDSNAPMSINTLIDSGAMGLFIDIDYMWSKNLKTQCLPRAIPVYNVDGTPNKVGHITEVINLIVRYKDHLE